MNVASATSKQRIAPDINLILYMSAHPTMLLSYSTIVLYSRDHKGVGVAHESAPKNQPRFPLTTMRQVQLSPNKLLDQPKMLLASYYGIQKNIYLMEFSTD